MTGLDDDDCFLPDRVQTFVTEWNALGAEKKSRALTGGEVGAPLFTVDFQTLGSASSSSGWRRPSLLQLLVVALIILIGRQAWQRWGRRNSF